jgi:hypothetical protein
MLLATIKVKDVLDNIDPERFNMSGLTTTTSVSHRGTGQGATRDKGTPTPLVPWLSSHV